jgi:hypothetical protein
VSFPSRLISVSILKKNPDFSNKSYLSADYLCRKEKGMSMFDNSKYPSPSGFIDAKINGVATDDFPMPFADKEKITPSESPDKSLDLRDRLYEHGRNRARRSGILEAKAEDISELTAYAEAMARETATEVFDDTKNLHDQLSKEELERNKKLRDELKQNLFHAHADVRLREEDLAGNSSGGEKPPAPKLLMIFGAVFLAITVALPLHDLIFLTIGDELLNWFLSLTTALVIGLFISIGILGDIAVTEKGENHD